MIFVHSWLDNGGTSKTRTYDKGFADLSLSHLGIVP